MGMDDDAVLRSVSGSINVMLLSGEGVKFQRPNFQNFLLRMKQLKPSLDYLREVKIPLPKSALGPFHYLDDVLHKARITVESCGARRSKLYLACRCQQIVSKIQGLATEISQVLDSLPWHSLPFSSHTRLQVERCNMELRRLKFPVDARDLQLEEEISAILKEFSSRSHVSPGKLKKILQQLDLESKESLVAERAALEYEKEQTETAMENIVINQLMALLNLVLEDEASPDEANADREKQDIPIPADFRCPLSQQLMSDPVIVASGQTYERAYIQHWLDQGNKTCPKTEQVLAHTTLIPNYTVKALIANWCEMNNVPLPGPPKVDEVGLVVRPAEPDVVKAVAGNEPEAGSGNNHSGDGEEMNSSSVPVMSSADQETAGVEETDSFTRTARPSAGRAPVYGGFNESFGRGQFSGELFGEAVDGSEDNKSPKIVYKPPRKGRSRIKLGNNEKLFDIIGNDEDKENKIRGLIEDLESTCIDSQRAAAVELRLLAKNNAEDRIRIANAGAIKSLVALLSSSDEEVQENSVTALLNLSLNEGNKHEIVEAGAVESLINILTVGNSEARQNAAATIFSLSVKQEYTAMIGAAGAIPPLVELLKAGSPRGKKDAATALFNLSIYHENKSKVVKAGAVKPLIDLICEPRLGMVDKAVAVLANLASTPEGRTAIGEDGGILALAEVVEAGSQRGKENAAAALLTLCTNSAKYRAIVFNEGVTPMLHVLSQTGTARGKEKASALLRIFREQRNARSRSQPSRIRPGVH